ncbi:antibiotic biosynthesis monooxygenase [Novosphingobium umbonatum]|uniref:Antibiotic biosynthesis monooxygenase n=1 Tax=Novosphingobium umbonatum TaxID=1908524 RepID=A0A437N674_9SPHN|nr:antibiotic biosynthesis monooxygenase [Novosphingobium umbonatum]RVU05420.1 antibiotic biosynthesis monooxygenase [Novosphingobium umbonatum]
MIFEIARLTIDPARAADFEAAVAKAEPFFRADKGCTSFALQQVIEEPGVYHLLVGWVSVEAHMVDFRETQNFQEWRALAGPFFVEPPKVVHVRNVIG